MKTNRFCFRCKQLRPYVHVCYAILPVESGQLGVEWHKCPECGVNHPKPLRKL